MGCNKKYNRDYRIATDERGSQEAIYEGEYFVLSHAVTRREWLFVIGLPLLVMSALWLAAGWQNTDAGRTLYIMLPLVAALAPLGMLWGRAVRLLRPAAFTRKERDRLAGLPNLAVVFAIFCGLSAIGALCAGIWRVPTTGWLRAMVLGGALACGGLLWRRWISQRIVLRDFKDS